MIKYLVILFSIFFTEICLGQLLIGRDTISVREGTYVLKMPWANGVNASNVSNMDLNFDGKKDIVIFDKPTGYGPGHFRCFINTGAAGQAKYAFAPDLSYRFPQALYWAVCFDYNCDSMEDIFCSTNGGVMVYKNISTPATGINFVLAKPLIITNYTPGNPSGITPLYASSIGVPGIGDIDGDGDLDILTFAAGGFFIEFHKNTSKETGHNCDSLTYEIGDPCWGKVFEDQCKFSLNYNQCFPKPGPGGNTPPINKSINHHAGSCLTCMDSDGDGDQDIIMGDIYCYSLQYAHNGGTSTSALITDTTKLYPNYPNKNNTQQVKMYNFPCAYKVDCNGDGKKDMVATPNIYGSENTNSLWYYKNTSTTSTVNFQYVQDNFLQSDMIEVGQNSYPVVFDYDMDGKKDLLIGNWGYFINDTLRSKLTLYRNIGTNAQPSYSLVSRDYGNVAAHKLSNAMPTIGDVDADGDMDICIGTSSGQIHWLENTAGAGNVCNFSVFHTNPFSFTTNSASAAPQLFDIDSDGKLDLMIGTKDGRIAYYKNTTTTTTAISFSLITSFFGGVDVKGGIQYSIDGYAAPFFYKEAASVTKLLVGSVTGAIYYYSVPSVLTNTCNLINASVNNINEGGQATPCFEDINNDGKRDLILGNGSGGLSFFSSVNQFVGIPENDLVQLNDNVVLYPNPANGYINLKINSLEFETGKLILYDLVGKEADVLNITSNSQSFLLTHLHKGIYFARIELIHNLQTVSVTKKIIIN